jgi:Family of unknown function (DUF5755)
MVRITSKCPPGVLCLSPGIVFFGVILIIGVIFGISQMRMPETPVYLPASAPPPVNVQVNSDSGGDDRFTRAPKPERNWVDTVDASAVWNSGTPTLPAIPTRGVPVSYQSMGVIKTGGGQILPLYGRRTASRSDRFQYYTRTDTYNPVQLPVEYRRRNCQDDVGCDELYDRDQVRLSATGETGEVTIYRFSGPTYIPGI